MKQTRSEKKKVWMAVSRYISSFHYLVLTTSAFYTNSSSSIMEAYIASIIAATVPATTAPKPTLNRLPTSGKSVP
jgi:hypothetical protein